MPAVPFRFDWKVVREGSYLCCKQSYSMFVRYSLS